MNAHVAQLALIGAALLAPSLGVLFWALRGRRVDDTRFCRRCRFDLTGAARDGLPDRCPECGSDLQRPRAVRHGRRRARRTVAVFALLCTLIAAAPVVILGIATLAAVDWTRHTPTRWLMNELEATNLERSRAVAAELTRRLVAGDLDARWTDGFVNKLLDVQAGRFGLWNEGLDTAMSTAWAQGALTPAQRLRFVRQATELTLTASPRARPGDPVRLTFDTRRALAEFQTPMSVRAEFLDAELSGTPLPVRGRHLMFTRAGFGVGLTGEGHHAGDAALPADTTPGEHEVRARWRFTAVGGYGEQTPLRWEGEYVTKLNVLHPDEPLAIPVRGGDVAAQARERLMLNIMAMPDVPGSAAAPASDGTLAAAVFGSATLGADVGLAFEIIVVTPPHADGAQPTEQRAGFLTSGFSMRSVMQQTRNLALPRARPGSPVRLELRPSRELAEKEALAGGPTSYVDEVIVIDVTWPTGDGTPVTWYGRELDPRLMIPPGFAPPATQQTPAPPGPQAPALPPR